jgi:transposase-like protein
MSALGHPIFQSPEKARQWLEGHLWGDNPVCGYCGSIGNATAMASRPGQWQCNAKECRKQFTVTVGTLFERSHIPLNKWLLAGFLICSSKKGISAHQMHRVLGITYKSAWFMMHRLREAMRSGGFLPPMGGAGKVVEADETYYGKPEQPRMSPQRKGRPYIGKKVRNSRPVVSLVERGGKVRSFHVPVADKASVGSIVRENIAHESRLHTDESRLYVGSDEHFASHESVKHSADEYVRGDVHTNSAEGYFSIFKRGMRGVYQHCAEKHLHRYLAEFDFRYNERMALGVDDKERAARLLKGIVGKRLTYRRTNESHA